MDHMDSLRPTTIFTSSNLASKPGPWQTVISEKWESTDSSAANTSSEEEDEARQMQIFKKKEVPSEYWHITKLIKYIKTGNETGTLIALCCLKEYDLQNEAYQWAIIDTNGLETLLNILETNDMECKLGSLQIISDLTLYSSIVNRILINMGAVLTLICTINEPAIDLQILSATTLSHILRIRRARRIARTNLGIPRLMNLNIPDRVLCTPIEQLPKKKDQDLVKLATVMMDVWFCLANSKKNREIMRRYGFIFILAKYLKTVHLDTIIGTMGTISVCAQDKNYRIALATQPGMVQDMVHHLLKTDNIKIRRYTSRAIASSAKDKVISKMIREYGAFPNLMSLTRDPEILAESKSIAAVTLAIWKLSNEAQNRQAFTDLDGLKVMINLLQTDNEDILTNACGVLSELLKIKENLPKFRLMGGIPLVVGLINSIYEPLLENIPLVLKACAEEEDSMAVIEDLDAIRLIWSMLRHKSKKIQGNATWALVPLVANVNNSGEMVRNFVGGLELVLNLLNTDSYEVLAAACAMLAVIAKDEENLNVLTDYNYVPVLANLIRTRDEKVQEHLADAIASCCNLPQNRKELGKLGALAPLAMYLESPSLNVKRSAAIALFELSKNPFNCVAMHESGITTLLLNIIKIHDLKLQKAAAGCLKNMRNTVLEAEVFHLVDKGFEADVEDDEDIVVE